MNKEPALLPKSKGFKDFRSESIVPRKQIVRDIEVPVSKASVRCEELRVLPKAYNEIASVCSELESRASRTCDIRKTVCEKVSSRQSESNSDNALKINPKRNTQSKSLSQTVNLVHKDTVKKPANFPHPTAKNKSSTLKLSQTSVKPYKDEKVFQNLIDLTLNDDNRTVKVPARKPRSFPVSKKDLEPSLSDYFIPSLNTEYVVKFPAVRIPVKKELPHSDPYAVLDLLTSFN